MDHHELLSFLYDLRAACDEQDYDRVADLIESEIKRQEGEE